MVVVMEGFEQLQVDWWSKIMGSEVAPSPFDFRTVSFHFHLFFHSMLSTRVVALRSNAQLYEEYPQGSPLIHTTGNPLAYHLCQLIH
jgi:hypothetical protein